MFFWKCTLHCILSLHYSLLQGVKEEDSAGFCNTYCKGGFRSQIYNYWTSLYKCVLNVECMFIFINHLFYFMCVYIYAFVYYCLSTFFILLICTYGLLVSGIQNSYAHYNNINRNMLIVVAKLYTTHVRLQGDPVYLHCNSTCSATSSVQWYRGQRPLTIDYKKYFLTENQGLIIMNVTSVDGATYHCQSGTIRRTEHTLRVTRKSFAFHSSVMLHYYTQ